MLGIGRRDERTGPTAAHPRRMPRSLALSRMTIASCRARGPSPQPHDVIRSKTRSPRTVPRISTRTGVGAGQAQRIGATSDPVARDRSRKSRIARHRRSFGTTPASCMYVRSGRQRSGKWVRQIPLPELVSRPQESLTVRTVSSADREMVREGSVAVLGPLRSPCPCSDEDPRQPPATRSRAVPTSADARLMALRPPRSRDRSRATASRQPGGWRRRRYCPAAARRTSSTMRCSLASESLPVIANALPHISASSRSLARSLKPNSQ